jgi:hypothetical protein
VRAESESQATTVAGRTPAASRCTMRMLRNGTDVILVYQAETGGAPALVFESTGISVSLPRFPADWRRLSEADLLRLRMGCDD